MLVELPSQLRILYGFSCVAFGEDVEYYLQYMPRRFGKYQCDTNVLLKHEALKSPGKIRDILI